MFYRDLGTDYSHFNGFLWEINARKTNFSPYKHSLGTNYVREPRYHCIYTHTHTHTLTIQMLHTIRNIQGTT